MPRRREILPALLLSGALGCNALFGIDDARNIARLVPWALGRAADAADR